jgi:hypothetical protein
MSEEPEVTQALPEGEAVVETPATEQAPETGTEQTPEEQEKPSEPEKPKHKPWFQERIDQLTREKYEERRRAEALEARLAEQLADPEKKAAPETPDLDKLVAERAAELRRTEQFNAKCDEIYSSGKSEFADFDDTLGNFKLLGGLSQPLLEAVTQLPDAHKVLHHLGSNMDEAARILSLAPVPMALELAKLSQSAPKPKPVSKAPPPIKPIDGQPTGTKSPEDMSMEEWVEWREAQLKH